MNIYFALGSNLGDRLQNLRGAVRRLEAFGHVSGSSDVFSTAPWGGVEQPEYLNACVRIESSLSFEPHEILKAVKNFEREMGRVESVRWGARKIDILPENWRHPENGMTVNEMTAGVEGEEWPLRVTSL